MSTDWTTELAVAAGVPFTGRSQNETWTIDGAAPENTGRDCAWAAAAAILEWLTGVRLPVDALHDMVMGEGQIGVTPLSKIQTFFGQYTSTKTTLLTPTNAVTGNGSLSNLVWQYTDTGRPLILLQQYSDTVTTLHYRAVTGIDPSEFILNESWNATRITQSYDIATRLFVDAAAAMGTNTILVGIERTRDTNL